MTWTPSAAVGGSAQPRAALVTWHHEDDTGIMNETQADTGIAGAGLALGGSRVTFLDRARIYACGITPYDVTHLGHAATFVWVDALARTLRLLGVESEICRNVTDVDDVLDA